MLKGACERCTCQASMLTFHMFWLGFSGRIWADGAELLHS